MFTVSVPGGKAHGCPEHDPGLILAPPHVAVLIVTVAAAVARAHHRMFLHQRPLRATARLGYAVAVRSQSRFARQVPRVVVAVALIVHPAPGPLVVARANRITREAAQQPIQPVVAEALPLTTVARIHDPAHIAGRIVAIRQVLQTAGIRHRSCLHLLQTPQSAACCPGMVAKRHLHHRIVVGALLAQLQLHQPSGHIIHRIPTAHIIHTAVHPPRHPLRCVRHVDRLRTLRRVNHPQHPVRRIIGVTEGVRLPVNRVGFRRHAAAGGAQPPDVAGAIQQYRVPAQALGALCDPTHIAQATLIAQYLR